MAPATGLKTHQLIVNFLEKKGARKLSSKR